MARFWAWFFFLASFEAAAKPPRLTLVIVVDAMGSDLLLRSRPHLKAGLAQLTGQGAYFPTARYEYARTQTAAGHATLATGANPWRHGAVKNKTVNRMTGKIEHIFMDLSHPVLEAAPSVEDVSPQRLMAETLSDRLRLATRGRGKSIALAGKARTAIPLAGHLGQAWWFNQPVGKFVTGTFYAKEFPPWVKAFNERKLPDSFFGRAWTLALPAKEYAGDDDRPFESNWNAIGRTFPHPLTGGLQAPGPQAYGALSVSPYMNDILVQLAKAAIEGEQLGKDDIPDILYVGLSVDGVYHHFGPFSWEMQDAIARLDKAVAELIAAAEKAAGGKANLVVMLSADHGGPPIPEEAAAAGMASGRFNVSTLQQNLSQELRSRFGSPDLVAGMDGFEVYLSPRAMDERKLDGAVVRRAAAQWLAGQPEVELALSRDDLSDTADRGGWMKALSKSYYPGRSGDVLLVPRPFYVWESDEGITNHGSPYAYDSEVPVIFWGKGIKPGIYRQQISPVDVAPTLAALLEIGDPSSSEGAARSEIFLGSK